MNIIEMLKNFWRDEDGGEIVEYAVVIGVLVVAVVGIMTGIKNGAATKFNSINAAVSQ